MSPDQGATGSTTALRGASTGSMITAVLPGRLARSAGTVPTVREPSSLRPRPADAAQGPSGRLEPWRDWALWGCLMHGLLLTAALTLPSLPWLLALSVPLSLVMAGATLTVLHDAGHKRFSSRHMWPNVFAVQTGVPVGLWVGHWTLKHRVHHRATAVYPLDDATRASSLVRFHPAARLRPIHRYQHLYAWPLYGLAWMGELRSQLTYLRTGAIAGTTTPRGPARALSFGVEKALCALVLWPYAVVMGGQRLLVLMLVSMSLAGVVAGVVLVVGHINVGLDPSTSAPAGREWNAHLVRTTANFSTANTVGNAVVRWVTGGMTHHLAHHLRPVAPRSELPSLHASLVADVSRTTGEPLRDFPTLRAAARGHWQRLKELGSTP